MAAVYEREQSMRIRIQEYSVADQPRLEWTIKPILQFVLCIGLAGCGEGGTPEVQRFDEISDELSSLAVRYDAVGFSDLSGLPSAGTARYSGLILLQLEDKTDPITNALAGSIDIEADFDGAGFGIQGQAHSFVDQDGDSVLGALELSAGSLDRAGDPQLDSTVSFDGVGMLEDAQSREINIQVEFSGDFYGPSHEALAGSVNGQATSDYGQQSVSGLFVAD